MPALRVVYRTLPLVKPGDRLSQEEVAPLRSTSKPPARQRGAFVVKELEKRGIGRPLSYASIICHIQDRSYVRVVVEKNCALRQKNGRDRYRPAEETSAI